MCTSCTISQTLDHVQTMNAEKVLVHNYCTNTLDDAEGKHSKYFNTCTCGTINYRQHLPNKHTSNQYLLLIIANTVIGTY